MIWNWQQTDWPNFTYDESALRELEAKFLYQAGVLSGIYVHLNENDKNTLKVELISDEALKTSEIEGEYLNRDSVQSSIKHNLGLEINNRKIPPAEKGVADMMIDLYQEYASDLNHNTLFNWHLMLLSSRWDLNNIGTYHTHHEPMQVVSGPLSKRKVHFEAPPSDRVLKEMEQFIRWFNGTSSNGSTPLPTLTRAGIAHLYFVCIHPFEDGNGRIGRAIAEKAISQNLGQATLLSLSHAIQAKSKDYYMHLERNNKANEITDWLVYFANTILEAQTYTINTIQFIIEKTKLYDKFKDMLNTRQHKVLTKLFHCGIEGFQGGLSAENYISITKTSRATATRDLHDLVEKNILRKTGELKSTRYYLNNQRDQTST